MASPAPPPSRREELLAKRARLLSEQAQRTRQRERADDLERFRRHMGAQLDAAGVDHELQWPEEERDPGPLQRYPIGFASVRWDLVPGVVQVPLDSGDGLREQLRGVLRELGVAPAAILIVDWCIGGAPRVRLRAGDLAGPGVELLRYASDTWVYAPGEPWLIEAYHEGTLSYAARPGRPEDAGAGWRRPME